MFFRVGLGDINGDVEFWKVKKFFKFVVDILGGLNFGFYDIF